MTLDGFNSRSIVACCEEGVCAMTMTTAHGDPTVDDGVVFAYYSRWLTSVPTYMFTTKHQGVPTTVGYFDERALMQWFGRRTPIHGDRMLRTWRGANAERAILTKKINGGRGTLLSIDALVVWLSNLRNCIVDTAKCNVSQSDTEWLARICRVSSTKTHSPWIVYSIIALAAFAIDLSRAEQRQQYNRLLATPPVTDDEERDDMGRHELLTWRDSITPIAPINTNILISPVATMTIQQAIRDGDELQLMQLRDQIDARISFINTKRSTALSTPQSTKETKRRRITPELVTI